METQLVNKKKPVRFVTQLNWFFSLFFFFLRQTEILFWNNRLAREADSFEVISPILVIRQWRCWLSQLGRERKKKERILIAQKKVPTQVLLSNDDSARKVQFLVSFLQGEKQFFLQMKARGVKIIAFAMIEMF